MPVLRQDMAAGWSSGIAVLSSVRCGTRLERSELMIDFPHNILWALISSET